MTTDEPSTMVRIIRSGELVRSPWKNGGGTTAEIAVYPEGAQLDRFDWRISMADVASDGPFSTFPDIDRTLVLVDGPGLVLTINGREVRLDGSAPSLRFDGEAETSGRLVGTSIRDLNIMTRRSAFSHGVRLLDAESIVSVEERTSLLLVAAQQVGVRVAGRGVVATLDRLDCLLIETPAAGTALTISGRAVLVTIGAA